MGPPTKIKMLNVAWSGSMNDGPGAGITTIAGKSKHYKSTYASHAMAGFLNKYEDGLVLYYNNEFGIKRSYLENCGVDIERICHIPFTSIESLIEDIVYKLEELSEKDKVIIVIDSISNSSTNKEYTDAMEQTGKNDMTKAKKVKSLMRLITPSLYMKNIPLIQICHTYMSQDLFSKTIINGGESIILNSDTIFLVSKSPLKESTNKEGFAFDLKIIKSRFIKEDSIVHILVRWDSGISIYSGFAELASEFGIIKESGSVKKKTYTYDSISKGVVEVPAKKIDINKDFWELVLSETDFQHRIESFYKLPIQKSIDQVSLDINDSEDDED
jgi:RecA/RadA recombinase